MICEKCEDEIYTYQEVEQDEEGNLYHEWCVEEDVGEKE